MRLRRVTCIALVWSLATAPVAMAAEPEPAPVDPELAASEALYREAEAKYSTADYPGAIEAWQKAFAALPRTAAPAYRSMMVYNIAIAYERLFELRGDVEYLKKARMNLKGFEASLEETYEHSPEDAVTVRAEVEEKIAHIDELIAKAEREAAAKQPPVEGPVEPKTSPGTDTRTRDPATGFFVGGGVLLALGVAAGAGMTAALVVGKRANGIGGIAETDYDARKERFDRGRAANAGAIAAGAIGLACLAGGVALLVVGSKRRASSTAAAPMVGRGLAGLAISGRF